MFSSNTTNFMVDIETLGTAPGSVILSIGAVPFGRAGIGTKSFYRIINRDTCRAAGLTEDRSTAEWWERQTEEAKKVLMIANGPTSHAVSKVLYQFGLWLTEFEPNVDHIVVWGNGAAFDNILIHEAVRRCGLTPLWSHMNDRCYRTLKNMRPDIKLVREGTFHNALDDARSQAQHAVKLIEALKL